MRKSMMFLLAGLAWLAIGSRSAFADGMFLPRPEALNHDYVAVRYHRVAVRAEDGHAVTRVEQEFYNPYDFAIQGRYVFPIPPDAVLSRFEATLDGETQAVDRQNAETTNAVLYDAVARQRDPSLLQYADWESLTFDLSLPPGGSRKMTLEYEEMLVPSGGLYRYHYVLSTERYSSLPVEEVSMVVDIRSSSGLASLYSSNHAVRTEWLGGGWARVSWEGWDVNPADDFELFFAPSDGGYGGGLLTSQRSGQDHFLFLFSPDAEPRRAAALPKDIVFVLDRSGSMGGDKIEQARGALRFILGQLGVNDRFSIISFNDRVERLSDLLRPVEQRSLTDANRFVDGLTADGSTDLDAALQAGLEVLGRSDSPAATRMVVFLTDGLPTAGITQDQVIAERVGDANSHLEARLHVFGVGYDVNTHLLDRLAAESGGTATYVQPGENLELVLTGFFDRIARPVLTDLSIEFEGLAVDQLYPQALPDLFQGSTLLLTGRYQAAQRQITVRIWGWAGDERREYVYQFDLDVTGKRDFVSRLWATRRVGALLDRVRVEGETGALVREIRELGLSYGIVTPYTISVIDAQAGGVASAANMALYYQADLNAVSGQTTVQARIQNQGYQEAAQANLATGANVANIGPRSLVGVGVQQVDLSLLRGYAGQDGDVDAPLSAEWIAQNIRIDRSVEFGSGDYFSLAGDPSIRPFLQSGPNVVFSYQGQVVAVWDAGHQPEDVGNMEVPEDGQIPAGDPMAGSLDTASSSGRAAISLLEALQRLLPLAALAALPCLVLVAAVIRLVIGLALR